MSRLLILPVVLLAAACGAPSTDSDAGADGGANADAGTDAGSSLTAEQQEWLTAHDAVRLTAMPTPVPALPTTHWSTTAASLAADWAARCNFMHRNPNTLGENLFASTSAMTPTAIVDDWASEKANYTYSTNTCAGVCGHYTQIVWRGSTGIGCVTQSCTTGSPFGSGPWSFTVCDYEPAGNINGRQPY
ncbi:MAG: CAP domain-containing protein [Myxococcaceae bacterium]